MSKTYPTPTHAEAFEERHGTFVDEDAPHAVEDTIQLSAFVSHETYFHDVWRRTNSQISRQVHTAGVGGGYQHTNRIGRDRAEQPDVAFVSEHLRVLSDRDHPPCE